MSKRQSKEKDDDITDNESIESEENNEEEYSVEKVLDVKVEKGQKYYLIKWEGYSSDDNSWEREEDCACKDLIEEFYRNREKQKNKKREKSSSKAVEEEEEKNNKKRKSTESNDQKSKQRKSVKTVKDEEESKKKPNDKLDVTKDKEKEKIEYYHCYVPEGRLPWSKLRKDSWENLIDHIESIEEVDESVSKKYKNEIIKLKVYVLWKDGVRSVHSNQVTNDKCPKKMIEFYENRISFLKK
jgi:hypothetical protein